MLVLASSRRTAGFILTSWMYQSLALASARRGTPRLKDWTPWMTQIFKTSKISATVAPCRSAALMNRRVLGAYRCEYEAPRAIFTNSMSFGGKALLK
jgi:hypothetical protein